LISRNNNRPTKTVIITAVQYHRSLQVLADHIANKQESLTFLRIISAGSKPLIQAADHQQSRSLKRAGA